MLEGFARKKLAGSLLRNPEDAADLAYGAVLVFLEKSATGERIANPKAFLCRTVEVLAAKNLESASRRKEGPLPFERDMPAEFVISALPEPMRHSRIPDFLCPPIWLELEGPVVDETGNVLRVETLTLGVGDREAARPAVRLVNLASEFLERKGSPAPVRAAALTWFVAAEIARLPGILRGVWGTGPLELEPGALLFHRKFSRTFRERFPTPTFRRPGERGDEKQVREAKRQGLALLAELYSVPGGLEAVRGADRAIAGFVAKAAGAPDPGKPFRLFN